jgi:N-acetylmuramoyl-L-alanine amidase
MYYTPWSHLLSKYIRENTKEDGVYSRHVLQWSAAYFMCRQPVCPVVLTENGFMSNSQDLADMVNPEKVDAKAEAMTQGIVDYFLAINQ